MTKKVEIKYMVGAGTQSVPDYENGMQYVFRRNIWKAVPENIAMSLLEDRGTWIAKDAYLNLAEDYKKRNITKYLLLERDYSLGDLLMLVPILRHYRKKHPHFWICLITNKSVVEMFKFNNIADDIIPQHHKQIPLERERADYHFNLNGLLELDQVPGSEERNMHRVDIYAKHLELELEEIDYTLICPRDLHTETRLILAQDVLKCLKP